MEIPILSKEHFNQWYSLESYYLSYTIVDLPIQVFDYFDKIIPSTHKQLKWLML